MPLRARRDTGDPAARGSPAHERVRGVRRDRLFDRKPHASFLRPLRVRRERTEHPVLVHTAAVLALRRSWRARTRVRRSNVPKTSPSPRFSPTSGLPWAAPLTPSPCRWTAAGSGCRRAVTDRLPIDAWWSSTPRAIGSRPRLPPRAGSEVRARCGGARCRDAGRCARLPAAGGRPRAQPTRGPPLGSCPLGQKSAGGTHRVRPCDGAAGSPPAASRCRRTRAQAAPASPKPVRSVGWAVRPRPRRRPRRRSAGGSRADGDAAHVPPLPAFAITTSTQSRHCWEHQYRHRHNRRGHPDGDREVPPLPADREPQQPDPGRDLCQQHDRPLHGSGTRRRLRRRGAARRSRRRPPSR